MWALWAWPQHVLLLLLQGLTFPLLENANEYIVHGFAYNDYLKQVDPPTTIGRVGASLDKAFASEWARGGFCGCEHGGRTPYQLAAHT